MTKKTTRKIEQKRVMMKTADLDSLAFNPASRTTPKAIQELLESIRENGILNPLWVAQKCAEGANVIIGGHRRYECAMTLSLAEVPVLLCTDTDGLTAQEIWNLLEGSTLSQSSLHWMEVYSQFHEEYGVPKRQLAALKDAEKLFGSLSVLIQKGIAPTVAREARTTVAKLGAMCPGNGLTEKQVGHWFVHHGTQRISREAIRHSTASGNKLAVQRLIAKIKANEPCDLADVYLGKKKSKSIR
jgi:ParB-like nuclease domain